MSTTSVAANAYAAAQRLANPIDPAGGAATAGRSSFGDVLTNALKHLGQTTQATDRQSQALAAGRADLIDVVTAVAETEVAIETLVSVRDRVVQSYEEIMRMQI
ncbi:MAG: flagellar hook-basal body complex protein FliE [Alphaproteobacteria bacterium]|jgi:flagellar hook-basal body complex protein FliE